MTLWTKESKISFLNAFLSIRKARKLFLKKENAVGDRGRKGGPRRLAFPRETHARDATAAAPARGLFPWQQRSRAGPSLLSVGRSPDATRSSGLSQCWRRPRGGDALSSPNPFLHNSEAKASRGQGATASERCWSFFKGIANKCQLRLLSLVTIVTIAAPTVSGSG